MNPDGTPLRQQTPIRTEGGIEIREIPRGKCPACYSIVHVRHEGRVLHNGNYYHRECVKGYCGYCNIRVCGDQRYRKADGVYYHIHCPER